MGEEREELTPISDALGDIIYGLNKQIASLTQELKDKTEALEDSNSLLKFLAVGEDREMVERQTKHNDEVLAKYSKEKGNG